MANWRYKIELRALLHKASEQYDFNDDDDVPEEVKEAVAQELLKAPPLREFADQVRDAVTVADLDDILRDVYDMADFERVWCGL